jgi:ribosomal protein S18 acetylase RimI-like enzyme
MVGFKLLIDTNVVIGLEDPQPVLSAFAEVSRLCSEHKVGLFVDSANYEDVLRDPDPARRAVTLSKLEKFQRLRDLQSRSEASLVAQFGPINSQNDYSDVRLLAAIDAGAADFLVTQDNDLRRRAVRFGLGSKVLTVEEALEWLRQTFQAKSVELPYVVEQKAYQIDRTDQIFDSLREDYPKFDIWFEKCRREHRDCWVLKIREQIAGLVIRKDENHLEAKTRNVGPKILKVCTFKVRDEYRGEKFGELLLKQILWFAQRNSYDLVYLTVYAKHTYLIDLLTNYGFEETQKLSNGELVVEKAITNGLLPGLVMDPLEYDRRHYPRFYDGAISQKFIVPIQPDYHRKLFPEIAFGTELPLFPNETFKPVLALGQARTPGNTIRKVYLCRAQSNQMRPGDLLFFYMSNDLRYAGSQSITTVGVFEQITEVRKTDDLVKATAKRSVFSADELEAMEASNHSPIKVIDFLLVGHSDPTVALPSLLASNIISAPPQSIVRLSEGRYSLLRSALNLGFAL